MFCLFANKNVLMQESLAGKTRLLKSGCCSILLKERFAMSDQDIQKLESQFPPASGSAFAAARERVLQSGQSVLQAEDGFIYEVFPDGSREVVKRIEPPIKVEVGVVYTIP